MDPLPRELGRRFYAWLLDHGQATSNRVWGDRKRVLLADLAGDVLEIGAGTGANLGYLPPGVRWTGIEPNPWSVERAARRAAALGVSASFATVRAEHLPADDGTFDAVICTLVLCSVRDPAAVLAEARRVLRPGGRFVFVEHVAALAGTAIRARQDRIAPMWSKLADGCCPNRETEGTIRAAGFASVTVDAFEVPFPGGIVTPQIAGFAVR